MDHEAILEFTYVDPERATLVERSIVREIDEIDGDRTRVHLVRDGATLTITVGAADPTALRAGLTTWTTLVEVAEQVGGG